MFTGLDVASCYLDKLAADWVGGIHPANRFLVRELAGKVALGINFDEQPRWG